MHDVPRFVQLNERRSRQDQRRFDILSVKKDYQCLEKINKELYQMKKKLPGLLFSLSLISSLVFAQECPVPSNIVFNSTFKVWESVDGNFYGVSEFNSDPSHPPIKLNYSFWKDTESAPLGGVVCGYATAGKDIEMIKLNWDVPKPLANNWQSGVWRQNIGLLCTSVPCTF